MKKSFLVVLITICSLLIGVGWGFFEIKRSAGTEAFVLKNGVWNVNQKMDLSDRYQRSLVALTGLFALRESEVLYFVARIDSEGNPLSAEFDYVLEGPAPNARYWSYTLYGKDFFLVRNDQDKFGFNLDNIAFDQPKEGQFPPETEAGWHQINISATEKSKNWLPSGEEEQFYINLRMYNPSSAVYENLETVKLPTIRRVR